MLSLTRYLAACAAFVALAAIPAVANAGTVPMRGVVSGSPYGASNGQMAVPVLFSKQTARSAGLKSPVGVIILKRAQKVKLPGSAGYALPVNLRTGDRFKGTGVVDSLQQRVFYPRIVFPKAVVYFRSKELSLSELSDAVTQLRSALASLAAQFNTFKGATINALMDIYGQLDALKKALAGLNIPAGVDLTQIQSQLDALSKKLNDLIAGLPDFSKFVTLDNLTSILAGYATKSYVDSAVAALQSQITALSGTVTTLSGTVSTLQSNLTTVCNAVKNATVTLPAPLNTTVPINVNTGGVC